MVNLNETIPNNTTVYYLLVADFTGNNPPASTLKFNMTNSTSSTAPNVATNPYSILGFTTTDGQSFTVGSTYNWKGKLNNDLTDYHNYNNLLNQDVTTPPGPNDIIRIGVVGYQYPNYQPTLATAKSYKGLVFGSTNSPVLTINAGVILTITGGLTINSGASPTIASSSASNVATVNVAGTSTVASTGTLQLSNKITIANTGAFTFLSDANGTGSVGVLQTASKLTGIYTVQRYFTGGNPSNRGWRLMSSPVNNSGNVPVSSTDTYNFSSLKDNMFVLSPGGTGSGFDAGTGYTILWYDTPTKLFKWPGTITSPRNVGAGFYYYFMGNRTPVANKLVNSGAGYATPETNVVGLQTGTLNQQSFTYTLANDNGGDNWNQVGNPYPSSISMPSAGGSGPGTPYTNTTGFIYTYTSKATSVTVAPNPVLIASGQGFFVRKVAGSSTGSVNFSESLKVIGQPSNLLLGLPVGTKPPLISLKMVQDSTNYDIAYLRFLDTYKKEYDEMEDADHLNGSGQTVFLGAMTIDNHLVALASQPLEKQKTSVFLNVNDSKSGLYSIEKIDISGIPPVYDVWLMDHFKKDSLDIRANSTYKFNLDKNNAETYGANRFEVVIRKKSLPPYQLISFTGKKSGADALLNWNTLNEYDYTSFELQKSTDGINFDAVRNMQSSSSGSYSFKDIYNNAGDKDVYYRLKQTDIYDQVTYSNIIIVSTQGDGAALSIFPNPASNIIQYTLKIDIKSGVRLRIFNTMGILMKNSTFTTSSGQQDISSLIPGNYTIELTDLNSKKIILTGKFIKI
nr:T9SS type A sorting domain-containing protein [Mucilaginibacter sp. L294]